MRQLIRLLERARSEGYFVVLPDKKRGMNTTIESVLPAEWKLFEEVEPFVFCSPDGPINATNHVENVGPDWREGWDNNERIDAPFKVFSIECLDGPLDEFTDTNGNEGKTWCILTIEIAPKKYGYYALCEHINKDTRRQLIAIWKSNMEGKTIEHYLDRLNKEQTGIETARATVKLGHGKEKRTHRIRRVIHVSPKRKIEHYAEGNIDWTHRFEVRGHWVDLPGRLGKDREGNYCIPNRTWRTNYIKGPEHLPLIKKVRIVTEGKKDE